MADSLMSFDDDENASIDKLEMTRNPFDSNLYEKENFPVLDSSIFTESVEVKRKSTGEFRWSIDQLAKLKPTEMDMNPNQEYSISYDKKEDEERDQEQVTEYFKNVLLPSPWLENRSEMLKRVQFSPHPPTTRYIQEQQERSSFDQSGSPAHLSTSVSESVKTEKTETMLADACCQTMLTFPMNLDLESLLGKQFFNYIEDDKEAKELMISSLRRKLFGQDNTPVKTTKGNPPSVISPGYTTSSPTKDNTDLLSHVSRSPSLDQSPSLSPVKSSRCSNASLSNTSVFATDNEFSPFKQASNVGTPQHLRGDISFSPVTDLSLKASRSLGMESDYSFLPGVSFDISDTEDDCIRESSRAVQFHSPDVSPIKYVRNSTKSYGNTTDSMDDLGVESIKESTARNMQAIFDMSSINNTDSNNTNSNACQQDDCDRGPLDISELAVDDTTLPSTQQEQNSTELDQKPCFEKPMEKQTDDQSNTDRRFSSTSSGPFISSTSSGRLITSTSSGPGTTPDSISATPLKSILKKRDMFTPTRTNLKDFDCDLSTKYNTECNSGRRKTPSKADFTRITPNKSKQTKKEANVTNETKQTKKEANVTNETNRPRPVLSNIQNRDNIEPYRKSNEEFTGNIEKYDENAVREWRQKAFLNDTTLNENDICSRANSVLQQAKSMSYNSIDIELDEKENYFLSHGRRTQLNSTEIGSLSNPDKIEILLKADKSLAKIENSSSSMQIDSGVASMEYSEQNIKLQTDDGKMAKIFRARSISPLLSFDRLSLYSTSPWNVKVKAHQRINYKNNRSKYKYLLCRSRSWPDNKSFSMVASPTVNVPRSRVTPRGQMSYNKQYFSPYNEARLNSLGTEVNSITHAYKELLQSPLK